MAAVLKKSLGHQCEAHVFLRFKEHNLSTKRVSPDDKKHDQKTVPFREDLKLTDTFAKDAGLMVQIGVVLEKY